MCFGGYVDLNNDQKSIQKGKLLWISPLILDVHLHKTTQIEMLRALAKRGYNTCLMAVYSKDKIKNKEIPIPTFSIPLRYIPMLSPIMFGTCVFFFLPFYIIIKKPRYIIANPDFYVLGFVSAIPFSLFKCTKLILDVRSTPVETFGIRGYLQRLFFDLSVLIARKFFNGMTIITELMKQEVCGKFKIDPKRVGVWSSGVSSSIFDPHNFVAKGKELRKKLGLSKKFIVFYHGALTANRGLIETIEAMDIIKQKYFDIVFFILGMGELAEHLKNLIEIHKLQNHVVLHDAVAYEEIPNYIEMSDVGIVPLPNHPYWRFQSPLKLMEYLAMEKTVIITDIAAHRTIIGEEKCGIYVSGFNPTETAKSIVYAYTQRNRLNEWGKRGRIIINRHYEWEKVGRDFDNYLLSL
jgi:glycosyltransferase involved in cell wall biosynthesis